MMVDLKFDALYRQVYIESLEVVSRQRKPSEVGLVEKLSGSLYWWVEMGVPFLHRECYRTL